MIIIRRCVMGVRPSSHRIGDLMMEELNGRAEKWFSRLFVFESHRKMMTLALFIPNAIYLAILYHRSMRSRIIIAPVKKILVQIRHQSDQPRHIVSCTPNKVHFVNFVPILKYINRHVCTCSTHLYVANYLFPSLSVTT